MPGKLKQEPDVQTWRANRQILLKNIMMRLWSWSKFEDLYKARLKSLQDADAWLAGYGVEGGLLPRDGRREIDKSEFRNTQKFNQVLLQIFNLTSEIAGNHVDKLINVLCDLLGLPPNEFYIRGDRLYFKYKRYTAWLIWSLSFIWYAAPAHWAAFTLSLRRRTQAIPEKPTFFFAFDPENAVPGMEPFSVLPVTLAGDANSQATAVAYNGTSRRGPMRALLYTDYDRLNKQSFAESMISYGSGGAVLIFIEIMFIHELTHVLHFLSGHQLAEEAEGNPNRAEREAALKQTAPGVPLTPKRARKIEWLMANLSEDEFNQYYALNPEEFFTISSATSWKSESGFREEMSLRPRTGFVGLEY